MKKEEIYINLQGKTKEELTDLWEFLISVGEKPFRDKESFPETNIQYGCLHLYVGLWRGYDDNKVSEKTEVTIAQLKEILQPMENKGEQLRKEAKERGYAHENFKCLINRVSKGIEDINKWHYAEYGYTLYSNTYNNGGNAVYKNGVWAEIVSYSLEQQLQKAEAEVKRLKEEIEADKIKCGDWYFEISNKVIRRAQNKMTKEHLFSNYNSIKITDQELINKLNELIK